MFFQQISRKKPQYFSKFLSLCSKIPQDALVDICLEVDFFERHQKRITVLLITDILSPDHKRQLGVHPQLQGLFLSYFPKLYCHKKFFEPEQFLRFCSPEELVDHSLERLNIFQILKLAQERQTLLNNLNLKPHALYLPFLFEIHAYRKELMKPLCDEAERDDNVSRVRLLARAGQEQIFIDGPDFSRDLHLETYLAHVVNNEKISTFVRFIEHFPDCVKMLKKPHIMPFLTVLLIHSSDADLQKRICRIIVKLVQKVPEQADAQLKFFTAIAVMKFFPISMSLIIEMIADLAVNKVCICAPSNSI